jgi:hypothetical protein
MQEFPNVRQEPNSFRRLFTGDGLDLYVWYESDCVTIRGFELVYPMGGRKKSIIWRKGKGYRHSTVDDGERPRYKRAPIHTPDGAFKKETVARYFAKVSRDMPKPERVVVYKRLLAFQENLTDPLI